MGDQALTDFQRDVTNVFFALPEAGGYLLAGGAALVASELTVRPTRDLDLFTHAPVESTHAARDALIVAATERRWTTTVIRNAPTFYRLIIHGPEDLVVDLAVDSPPASPPTTTLLGPTLAPLELAARKLLALSAAPRRATSPTSTSSNSDSVRARCSTWPRRSTPDSTSTCLPRC